jgi:hypothetical protein
MTATESAAWTRSVQPIDVVAERLDDQGVAASLVTPLDNAELPSTGALGLSGVISRGEMIVESPAEGLSDIRTVSAARPAGVPSLADLETVTSELAEAAPALRLVRSSSMTSPQTTAPPDSDTAATLRFGQPDVATSVGFPYQAQTATSLRSPDAIDIAPLDGRDARVVADTGNNRVLGQPGFGTNGENRWNAVGDDMFCRPSVLSMHGGRVAAADSGDDRVMIWELS